MPKGHKVSRKQNLLASLSCTLFNWSQWIFNVVLKWFKLNIQLPPKNDILYYHWKSLLIFGWHKNLALTCIQILILRTDLIQFDMMMMMIIIITIMSVFLERLSMWNILNCAEQVQIQKYKTHAYKTLKTVGVQIIMLKHPTMNKKPPEKPIYRINVHKNIPNHTN